MVNLNKISDIKSVLESFLREIEHLGESGDISYQEWEALFEKASSISGKLYSLKIEYNFRIIENLRKQLIEQEMLIGQMKRQGMGSEESAEDEELEFEVKEYHEVLKAEEQVHEVILDKAKGNIPEWMREMPGPKVDNINKAITLNDRLYFIKDLFLGDNDQFRSTIQNLNELDSLSEAVEYLNSNFPDWNKESAIVNRFYLTVRRRYDV